MEDSFQTTMSHGEKNYHHNGNVGNEGSNFPMERNYRKYSGLDHNSDEFLNDYIPKDTEMELGRRSVLWKDVLALGMIPETRNNTHIRPELQYKNQIIEFNPSEPNPCLGPEAPSPAPAPSVIHAEPISDEFIKECNYISDTINLKISNTMNKMNYIHKINSKDEFWKQNSQYFPNFEKFYDILNSSFS